MLTDIGSHTLLKCLEYCLKLTKNAHWSTVQTEVTIHNGPTEEQDITIHFKNSNKHAETDSLCTYRNDELHSYRPV